MYGWNYARVLGYLSNLGELAGLQYYQNYWFGGYRKGLIYITFLFDADA